MRSFYATHKMHVLYCSYYTIRTLISTTLTGTYEEGYTYVFEMCCYRILDIVLYIYIYCYIYILLLVIKYVYKRLNFRNIKQLCSNVALSKWYHPYVGPEDDSIRIETCCPNTIINIIKFLLCLTDTLLCIYIERNIVTGDWRKCHVMNVVVRTVH